jgi:hypothetical protein
VVGVADIFFSQEISADLAMKETPQRVLTNETVDGSFGSSKDIIHSAVPKALSLIRFLDNALNVQLDGIVNVDLQGRVLCNV